MPQPCDNTYGTFEYGTGVVYGPSTCDEEFVSFDTPARDLVEAVVTSQVVINNVYLNPENYILVDTTTGLTLGVRKVLQPMNKFTTNKFYLKTDKHIAGHTLSLTTLNMITSKGEIVTFAGKGIARTAKADSMLAGLPSHFNRDPADSILRHLLQAFAQSDDLIGGL